MTGRDIPAGRFGQKWRTAFFFFLCAVLAGAVLTAALVAARGKFNASPDEYVTGAAIHYYESHWLPPDIRNPALSASYSGYGRTRLAELDLYYFAAGKAAALAGAVLPHAGNFTLRFFNVLMLAVMAAIALKVYRKNPALTFILALTPQLWYLYAYATSDAFDFFAGYLLLWQGTTPGSALNRLLSGEGKGWRKALGVAAGAVPLALLLTAKKNYYVLLLVAAAIAVVNLIRCPKEKRKALTLRLAALAACTLALFTLRYSLEWAHYGLGKSQVVDQQLLKHALPAYRPSTEPGSRFIGLGLRTHGVSLINMFVHYGFLNRSFDSFCGLYGNMIYAMPVWYYTVMAAIYLLLFVLAVREALRRRRGRTVLAIAAAAGALLLALSALNSWCSDFQPQGRYLLPFLIAAGFAASEWREELFAHRGVVALTAAAALLSLGSFVFGGLFLLPAGI